MLGRIQLDGDQSGLVLRPSTLPTLLGRVHFEDGAPDHAHFDLRSEEGWTWKQVRVSRSSPRFMVDDAPPGRYILENTTPGAFLLEEPALQLAEGGVERVEVTLSSRFARIRGTVRGAGDAIVRVELRGPAGVSAQSAGPAGSFAFNKLAPGEYALCAVRSNEACPEERRRRFPVEPGDDIELELGAPE